MFGLRLAAPLRALDRTVRRLLAVQRQPLADFVAWAVATPYFAVMARSQGPGADLAVWLGELVAELVRAGAAAVDDGVIVNAG